MEFKSQHAVDQRRQKPTSSLEGVLSKHIANIRSGLVCTLAPVSWDEHIKVAANFPVSKGGKALCPLSLSSFCTSFLQLQGSRWMHGVIALLHLQGLPHILRPISAPIKQSRNLKSGTARGHFGVLASRMCLSSDRRGNPPHPALTHHLRHLARSLAASLRFSLSPSARSWKVPPRVRPSLI